MRLEIAPNLKKDCAPGPIPEFKVSGTPKNGSVITKVGKLKTPASYRCPNKEAAVQALFYQPNNSFTGSNEVTFEVKSADGQVQTQNIKIAVGAAGSEYGDDAKKEGTDLYAQVAQSGPCIVFHPKLLDRRRLKSTLEHV